MTAPLRRIGIVSDTHGLVRPEALTALRGVDAIVHAGDVGSPDVLEAFARIAPVTAVRGNNDRGAWARALPTSAILELPPGRLRVVHDRKELHEDPPTSSTAVVVFGHSHQPSIERCGGVLWVNPGSAGPRRFRLPVAVARLTVTARGLRVRIVELAVSSPTPRRHP